MIDSLDTFVTKTWFK